MKTDIQWYESRFPERLALCERYIAYLFDADRDGLPYFGVNLRRDGRLYARHVDIYDLPHVPGRACDIIFSIENATGVKIDPAVEKRYTDFLFRAVDPEDGLPVHAAADGSGSRVDFHSLREYLEGLVWLIRLRHSDRAAQAARKLLETIGSLTDPIARRYSPALLKTFPEEKAKKYAGLDIPLTVGQGRLAGPLLLLHEATGDLDALRLADWYAHSTLETCFRPDGSIRDEAGTHVHSLTSTLSGALAFALRTGDRALREQVEAVCENGLRDVCSSYGYCNETLWTERMRGESNQVGDLIQIQLMLAGTGDPARWYARAERFMRGGILPAQVLTTDGYTAPDTDPACDAERDMRSRAIGGFGFPDPVSHLLISEHDSLNTTDITQGAVQAICAFLGHIAACRDGRILLNLYFDTDTDFIRTRSELPVRGQLRATVLRDALFAARIPEGCRRDSFTVRVNGREVPYLAVSGYAEAGPVRTGDTVEIGFEPLRLHKTEYICHRPYEEDWFGEQITGISPPQGLYPLFGPFPV